MKSRPSSDSAILEQASAWAVRLSADDISDADFEALDAWLALAPEHGPALTLAQGLWDALDEDRPALDAALVRSAPSKLSSLVTGAGPRRLGGGRPWRLAAAGLTAAAAAVVALVIVPGIDGRTIVYTTAPGEQKTVTLADGTTIAMNGGSTLSVRFSAEERRVEMESAEAAFDVAHDAYKPFRVVVGESKVEVLGTAFDIRRDADATRVSVSRGVVRVSDLADPTHSVRLTRGQEVEREDRRGALDVVATPAETAGWRTGRLVYDDRPLADVVEDLNRAYARPIRLAGDVADLRLTGVLELDDQAKVIRRLEAFLPVSASDRGGVIELRPR